jgi:ribosomal protein S6--L-glutamate ligase
MFEADTNLLCAGRDPGASELTAIQAANAVILPQACRQSLYEMAKQNCPYVFPDYDARFGYPDKIGQIRLFETMGVPHPKTRCYRHLSEYVSKTEQFPLVFKFDWGGEGDTVFLIRSDSEFQEILKKAELFEKTGQKGFLIQEYIPFQRRSLRVAVISERFVSYWRVLENPEDFHANLSKGAVIDRNSDPDIQQAAINVLKKFCKQTKINLAGFDFLISQDNQPLFLEINYFFGREGLGGSEKFYDILIPEIRYWLETVGNITDSKLSEDMAIA